MRVLVTYASHFGATRGIAERIAETLRAHGLEVDVVPVADVEEPIRYDAFVIGGTVHGGHWLKPATEFARLHAALLSERPVWLLSSGPIGERYLHAEQPEPKEIDELRGLIRPRDHRTFAGAFDRSTADFSTMGILGRTVVKRFLPEGDFRDWPAIEA